MTICEQSRCNRFGHVVEGKVAPNAAGEMILETWKSVAVKFPGVTLDAFVLMPNHFHGLVTFASDSVAENASLSDIVQWFKTMTTNWYIQGVKSHGWARFDGRLWQRSFHDRIVRSDKEMERFQTYIANNPSLWRQDTFFEP